MIATRWRALDQGTIEASTETPNDCHVIGIALRGMQVRLSVCGRPAQEGGVAPGALLVTGPGISAHCVFQGPFDEIHLHVPNGLIRECADDMPNRQPPALPPEEPPSRDPAVERLGRALLEAKGISGPVAQLYIDGISTAIIARLLSRRSRMGTAERGVTGLARWRLKRTVDYVEAHLAEPRDPCRSALAAGLTRMHFAAQFKAATGLRPHEYLLRRRVERAQELLTGTGISLAEVALSVGFQTQSHFTSVFKSFVGQPPHAWRLSHGGGCRGVPKKPCVLERRPATARVEICRVVEQAHRCRGGLAST